MRSPDHMRRIVLEIERKLQWGSVRQWKNRSFIELSNKVKRASGVRISTDTLKRIFGKVPTEHDYDPQLATKDALAKFLEYEGWYDYLESSGGQHKIKVLTSRNVVGGVFLVVLLLAIFIWRSGFYTSRNHEFSIQGKYLLGDAYHTVAFEYDLSEVDQEEIYLDFGDGTRSELDKELSTITHYYRGPGLYPIHLFIGGKIMYDTVAYLTTDGWEAHTFFDQGDHVEYLPIHHFKDSLTGLMQAERNVPMRMGIDTTKMYWVQFSNYKNYGIDGDHFILESVLKNDLEIVPARCNHIKIHVIGENGSIKLYFLREGCSRWVQLEFGEVKLQGTNQDLSAFGKDFLDFQSVRIENRDKRVKVYFNDIKLIEQHYTMPLGEIKGVAYIFSGIGGAVKRSEITGDD